MTEITAADWHSIAGHTSPLLTRGRLEDRNLEQRHRYRVTITIKNVNEPRR